MERGRGAAGPAGEAAERIGEKRIREQRMGEQRMGEQRIGEQSMGEQRMGEQRIGEQRIGEQSLGEQRIGEQRIGEQRIGALPPAEAAVAGTATAPQRPPLCPSPGHHPSCVKSGLLGALVPPSLQERLETAASPGHGAGDLRGAHPRCHPRCPSAVPAQPHRIFCISAHEGGRARGGLPGELAESPCPEVFRECTRCRAPVDVVVVCHSAISEGFSNLTDPVICFSRSWEWLFAF
ncbi:uncharacterized protein LOC120511104 [Passer montanus]|uniref:uncharacterized protein LOC120511104 n=1 Tax=Passer montanus TaxID=9160 RepID=UPI0019619C17|nr:uncharacterized protein LOC120511104 [Passer montanus]